MLTKIEMINQVYPMHLYYLYIIIDRQELLLIIK